MCGTANTKCNPQGYTPTYNWGSAVQFIDNNAPNANCTDNSGVQGPCTPNCEVIGVGIPSIKWMDPTNPGQGVNVSYYSVPDQSKDGAFECPTDPVVRAWSVSKRALWERVLLLGARAACCGWLWVGVSCWPQHGREVTRRRPCLFLSHRA